MCKTLLSKNGAYYTKWPFREEHFESPNSMRFWITYITLYSLLNTQNHHKVRELMLEIQNEKKNVSEKKRNVHVHHKHFGYLFRMNSFKLIKREMCTNKCPFVQDRKRRNDQTYCMYLYVASFIILFLLLKKNSGARLVQNENANKDFQDSIHSNQTKVKNWRIRENLEKLRTKRKGKKRKKKLCISR